MNVNRSAVGTRIAVTASHDGGTPWTVHRTLYSGTCFSASSGYELFFGLRNADRIEQIDVTWPDGTLATVDDAQPNTTVTIRR